MDETRHPTEALYLPIPGQAEEETPPGFVPLRLLLQPGGLCVELTRPDMLVGRHSAADVRLRLPDVSRRHCRFVFRDGQWEVVDLNSLNGVVVNGQRLREATLRHGDTVQIATLTFLVDLEASPRPLTRVANDGDHRTGVLRSIVDVLPLPGEQRRKAS